MASAGFDWLCVDMEHTVIDYYEAELLIATIQSKGLVPYVRVGENNANLIKRVMDIGAHGVIVPNVNSAEEARQAVESVKYPPSGSRGVGLYRAQRYGRKFKDYLQWLENESVVIIQIENIKAIDNIDEIFATKGIDAFLIGPYDLSASMNITAEFDHPEFIKTLRDIKIPS